MDPVPVPGTVQAIWHDTLRALRTAGHGQAAALWEHTSPVERSPETYSVSVTTPWLERELAKPRLAPLIGGALARAVGAPVRLCVTVCAAPSGEDDDPIITALLRRLNAKHKGLAPPGGSPQGYKALDETPPVA
jgi:hypothetical protein